MNDLISRSEAITAIQKAYADTEGGTDKPAVWKNVGLTNALHIMQDLPSAQPEKRTEERTETHACDLIERQAAISVIAKWMLEYGGEGEERERNALKQAAEEIKDLPSTQPDLSEYSDKLWKKAYERGKADARTEIVRCRECRYYKSDGCFFSTAVTSDDGFCHHAERRTDE